MGCFNEKEAHQALWDGKKLFFLWAGRIALPRSRGFRNMVRRDSRHRFQKSPLGPSFSNTFVGASPSEYHCGVSLWMDLVWKR